MKPSDAAALGLEDGQRDVDRKLARIARIYAEHAAPITHNATSIPCRIDGAACSRTDCAAFGCAAFGDPVHGRLLTAAGLDAFTALRAEMGWEDGVTLEEWQRLTIARVSPGRAPIASSRPETQYRPMDEPNDTDPKMRAAAQAVISDLRASVEAEKHKTLPERARTFVEAIGEPMALAVAGWLELEADVYDRSPENIEGQHRCSVALRDLALALQDVLENG